MKNINITNSGWSINQSDFVNAVADYVKRNQKTLANEIVRKTVSISSFTAALLFFMIVIYVVTGTS